MMVEKGKERGRAKRREKERKSRIERTVIIKVSYNVIFISM